MAYREKLQYAYSLKSYCNICCKEKLEFAVVLKPSNEKERKRPLLRKKTFSLTDRRTDGQTDKDIENDNNNDKTTTTRSDHETFITAIAGIADRTKSNHRDRQREIKAENGGK